MAPSVTPTKFKVAGGCNNEDSFFTISREQIEIFQPYFAYHHMDVFEVHIVLKMTSHKTTKGQIHKTDRKINQAYPAVRKMTIIMSTAGK